MRLTDIVIRALPNPDEGAVVFNDDLIPGFGVRVSEGGTKSFVLTHGPRRQRETLGRVGVLSLQEARGEAKRRLAEYTLGKVRFRSLPWEEALPLFLQEVERRCRPLTRSNYEYTLKRHFRFGATQVNQISPNDITKKLDRLGTTPAEQQRAYVTARVFFRWCHRRHLVETNPMERMQEPHQYQPRERVLTNDELRSVWCAAGDDTFGCIVKMLVLNGQRRGETTRLGPKMVRGDLVTVPPEFTKNGREHTFPIGPLSQQLLADRHIRNGLYFAAHGKDTPFNGFSPCKRKLDKRCGVVDWTLHDLRRTFATGMASLGVTLPVVERTLNHVSGSFAGVVAVYQKYDFLREMRAAAVLWEAHITRLTAG